MKFKNWFNELYGGLLNQTVDATVNDNLGVRSKYISSSNQKQNKVKKAIFGFKKEK